MQIKKNKKNHDDIDGMLDRGKVDSTIDGSPVNDVFEKTIEFFEQRLEQYFPADVDRKVAESIIYLCKNKDNIDNYNKKALYIMIREMTNVKTSKITQVSNAFRAVYPKIQREVLTKGHIKDLLAITGSINT